MPSTYTYPGVYVEEVPSGVRTITGVATSIAAFIGRARRGPTDRAATINSFADFERTFGGLWTESSLSYAVRDYFRNGGSQAVIVRLYHPAFASDVDRAAALAAAQAVATAAKGPAADVKSAVDTAAGAIAAEPAKSGADAMKTIAATAAAAGGATAASVHAALASGEAAAKAIAAKAVEAKNVFGADKAAVKSAVDAAAATFDPGPSPQKSMADKLKSAAATAAAAGGATAESVSAAAEAAAGAATTVLGAATSAANAKMVAAANAAAAGLAPGIAAKAGKVVADAVASAAAAAGALPAALDQAATAAVSDAAPIPKAKLTHDTLALEAANEGAWGSELRVRVDHDVAPGSPAHRFNLSVKDMVTGQVEVHRNVSMSTADVRRVDKVLASGSALLRVRGALAPGILTAPAESADPAASAADPFDDPSATSVLAADASGDGTAPDAADYVGSANSKTGLYRLEDVDLVNIVCIPPPALDGETHESVWSEAIAYCLKRRAILIIDPPVGWSTKDAAKGGVSSDAGIGAKSINAVAYFPRVRQANPLRDNQIEEFVPCGVVAGVIARTDATRGVWKAPAGLDAQLVGVDGLAVALTDAENGELNPLGLNCLRTMPAAGRVVWGARTRAGDDRLASEWKYLPVRRTALFIEESLYRGTQWVVFEPNDEPLWAQIRLNIGAFMNRLFQQGAFQGASPREAYFVKCDRETTTQADIDLGIVNILVGFAPLKPAEFVVIRIQQMAGRLAS